jgi:hypothetical protein
MIVSQAQTLVGMLDIIAEKLNKAPDYPCIGKDWCDRQKARQHQVPYVDLNPRAMCCTCAALWYVNAARSSLEGAIVDARIEEADHGKDPNHG